MRRIASVLTIALGALGLSGAALAGSAESAGSAKMETTGEAALETQAGEMPATRHQEQVIEGEVQDPEVLPPRGRTEADMPITEHQEELLKGEAGTDGESEAQTR
jgi:hypothetical protein